MNMKYIATLLLFLSFSAANAVDWGGALQGATQSASDQLNRSIAKDDQIEAENRAFARRMAELDRYERMQKTHESIRQLQEEKKQLASENERLARQLEMQKVEAVFPGWQETIKTEKFKTWYKQQPQALIDMGNSWKSEDALFVLNAYKSADKKKK